MVFAHAALTAEDLTAIIGACEFAAIDYRSLDSPWHTDHAGHLEAIAAAFTVAKTVMELGGQPELDDRRKAVDAMTAA